MSVSNTLNYSRFAQSCHFTTTTRNHLVFHSYSNFEIPSGALASWQVFISNTITHTCFGFSYALHSASSKFAKNAQLEIYGWKAHRWNLAKHLQDNNNKLGHVKKQQKNCFILLLIYSLWQEKFDLISFYTWQTVEDSSHSTKIALAVKKSRGASIKGVVKDWKKSTCCNLCLMNIFEMVINSSAYWTGLHVVWGKP